ncbi:MAG: DUF2158 domain-containing protein [Pseudomonadota bacterium]
MTEWSIAPFGEPIVIYGPKGTGKEEHQEAFARHYARIPSGLIDARRDVILQPGHLYISEHPSLISRVHSIDVVTAYQEALIPLPMAVACLAASGDGEGQPSEPDANGDQGDPSAWGFPIDPPFATCADAAAAQPFKIGDVVSLKSSAWAMTVTYVDCIEAECSWFDGRGRFKCENFHRDALTKVANVVPF